MFAYRGKHYMMEGVGCGNEVHPKGSYWQNDSAVLPGATMDPA